MIVTEREKRLYGSNVNIIQREDDCTIYQIQDSNGYAEMISYQVFDGIELTYNNIHMPYLDLDTLPPKNMFEINHCYDGRIEFSTQKGKFLYLAKENLAINNKDGLRQKSYFPLNYFHGITISIELDQTHNEIMEIIDDVKINLPVLREKLCECGGILLIRESQSFSHIFSELYEVPQKIRKGYYKLKVLEILLFLSSLELEDLKQEQKYYAKKQVEIARNIKDYLTSHLSEKITLEQLSKQFKIPLTTMKTMFRDIYGTSVYSFFKTYRIQKAAELLVSTELGINEIAGEVGYENASKFTEAFKKTFHVTPREYRKNVGMD